MQNLPHPYQSLADLSRLCWVWVYVATYLWCLNCLLSGHFLQKTCPALAGKRGRRVRLIFSSLLLPPYLRLALFGQKLGAGMAVDFGQVWKSEDCFAQKNLHEPTRHDFERKTNLWGSLADANTGTQNAMLRKKLTNSCTTAWRPSENMSCQGHAGIFLLFHVTHHHVFVAPRPRTEALQLQAQLCACVFLGVPLSHGERASVCGQQRHGPDGCVRRYTATRWGSAPFWFGSYGSWNLFTPDMNWSLSRI